MTFFLVFSALVLLAVIFGTDSRDGRDWTRMPPPLG